MRNIDIVATEILKKFSSWQSARRNRDSKWIRHSKMAKLHEEKADNTRGVSTIKMPATKSAITIAIDNLYQMLFGGTSFFDIEGRNLDDNPEKLKKYLEYLLQKDRVKPKFRNFLYDLCTYGTGICRVNVKTEIDKSVKLRKNSKFKTPYVDKTHINRPEFEWVNIFDFFIEPQTINIQNSEGVIIRKSQKIYRLREQQSQGLISGVEILEKIFKTDFLDSDKTAMLESAGVELNSDDITLFEYWGWMGEDILRAAGYEGEIKNGGAEIYAEIANGSVVLKLTANPFITGERPFFKECFEGIPGQFYGLGICDIAQGPQKALDATIRSRLDNKKYALNQVFAVDINRISEDENGDIFPGKTFFTEGNPRDIIQQLDIRDVTQGSYIEAQEFERFIHEATGISPILAGITGQKSQSATEASIAQSQSNMRLKMVALQIEENVTTQVLRWFYQIAMQFLNTKEVIKVTNADLFEDQSMEITRESILGDYDFIPLGVMHITARNNFHKIMDFLTRTGNQFDVQVTNRTYLLREAYKALGFNDADKVFGNNANGTNMLQNTIGTKGVSSPAKMTQEKMYNAG